VLKASVKVTKLSAQNWRNLDVLLCAAAAPVLVIFYVNQFLQSHAHPASPPAVAQIRQHIPISFLIAAMPSGYSTFEDGGWGGDNDKTPWAER
jgi:hypothetical protein